MNITQKRYVIDRAFNILVSKLEDLRNKDRKEYNAFHDKNKVSVRDLLKAISSKKAPLKKSPDIDLSKEFRESNYYNNPSLHDLFDFSTLFNEKEKYYAKHGYSYTGNNHSHNDALKHPDKPNLSQTFSFNNSTSYNKLKKANMELRRFTDEIMIGSEETAMVLLANLEAMCL